MKRYLVGILVVAISCVCTVSSCGTETDWVNEAEQADFGDEEVMMHMSPADLTEAEASVPTCIQGNWSPWPGIQPCVNQCDPDSGYPHCHTIHQKILFWRWKTWCICKDVPQNELYVDVEGAVETFNDVEAFGHEAEGVEGAGEAGECFSLAPIEVYSEAELLAVLESLGAPMDEIALNLE